MKNSKQVISAGVITALILSNVIIGEQYSKDNRANESKITSQMKLIEQYKVSDAENKKLILKNQGELKSKDTEINNLNTQLDQIKKENDDLKKQLQSRKEMESKRTLNIEATAYTATCKGCTGFTATGIDVRNTNTYQGYQVIAADWSVIPLYSIVRLQTKNGLLDCIVMDKGGGITANKIDILMNTYDEAISFGRQNISAVVLREGKG